MYKATISTTKAKPNRYCYKLQVHDLKMAHQHPPPPPPNPIYILVGLFLWTMFLLHNQNVCCMLSKKEEKKGNHTIGNMTIYICPKNPHLDNMTVFLSKNTHIGNDHISV